MKEYIEREAAINAVVGLTIYEDALSLNAAVERKYHNGREWIGGVRDALVELSNLLAADVRPVVRGEWIVHNSLVGNYLLDENEVYVCSACKAQRTKRKYNYCPNCGAEMKED